MWYRCPLATRSTNRTNRDLGILRPTETPNPLLSFPIAADCYGAAVRRCGCAAVRRCGGSHCLKVENSSELLCLFHRHTLHSPLSTYSARNRTPEYGAYANRHDASTGAHILHVLHIRSPYLIYSTIIFSPYFFTFIIKMSTLSWVYIIFDNCS